jgi:hypothetical protein
VASAAPPVVAQSVVASNLQSNATTNATTKPSTVTNHATTAAPLVVAWRIEINRRKKADGGWSYHWLYRFGSGDERRSVYGGTADKLIALNPDRWRKYLEVTDGKKRKK